MRNPIGKFVVVAAAVATVFGGGAAALAANTSTVRPHVAASISASTLTPLVQEFSSNTSPFCPAGSGNVPCDGAVGDYGTITRVASGTNGVPTLAAGEPGYAETAGSQATSTGCPSGESEYCTGPYALFDGGQLATFPSTGFTVTTDLYLTPAEPGDITADIGLNNSDGAYGNDIFINFCPVTGGGLAVSAGTMESCDGATTAQITKAGWYRLVWDFTPDAGNVALNQSVTSEATGYAVWSGELDAPVTVNGAPATTANTGGPSYFWIPTENTNSLPLSNFAVQLGSYPGGSAPDTVSVTNPGTQAAQTGTQASLQVQASSTTGSALSYSATGLPAGMTINASGLISGTPATAQSYTATVTATDAYGDTGSATFTWNVTAGPPADAVTITSSYPYRHVLADHAWVKFSVAGKSSAGDKITYSIKGAKFLSVNGSGVVRGRAVTGRYTVTVTATDSAGKSASKSFRFVVR